MLALKQKQSTPVIPVAGLFSFDFFKIAVSSSAFTDSAARLAYIRRTSMSVLLRQKRQELAAQVRVLEKGTTHDAVRHHRLVVLDAAPVHAEVIGLHDDGQAVGLDAVLQLIGKHRHGL